MKTTLPQPNKATSETPCVKSSLNPSVKALLLLSFLLCVQLGWGQASLPISVYTSGKASLPTGFSQSGLGSDYAASATKLKFDNAGDYLIIYFTGTPSVLTYSVLGNPSSGTSTSGTFLIQESSDGSSYTTIRTITNATNSSTVYTNNPSGTTRYLKFIYSSKSAGNIGLGTISLTSSSVSHSVTFNSNSGTGIMSNQTASSATALTTNAFTRTGYTFAGWNTAANGSGTAYANGASYGFAADVTLYAQWVLNHTVTFNSNSGTGSMSNQTASSATVLTTNAFTRTGYTFAGWNTAANGSGTTYANGASYSFAADVTLYAQWTVVAACTAPTLAFATSSYSKTVGDAGFTQTASSNSAGAITYSSSNTAIASVNSSTGVITLGATTGTATITATQAANGSYCAATATYTIVLSAASGTTCPTIEGAMINSCGTSEGPNEFVVFNTNTIDVVSAYVLYYDNDSDPKSSSIAKLSGAAASSKIGTGSVTTNSGIIIEVTSPTYTLPAGARVVFIPDSLDQAYNLSNLCAGGTLYVVYIGRTSPSSWSLAGNFANSSGDRYLMLDYNNSGICDVVSYNSGNFSSNEDGNFVFWDAAGTASYSNNGCLTPALCVTPVISGSSSLSVGDYITLTADITGGTWASSNTSVATVNSSGVVYGVAVGSANITYTNGTCVATKAISVSAATVTYCKKILAAWDFEDSNLTKDKGYATATLTNIGSTSTSWDKTGIDPANTGTNESTAYTDTQAGIGWQTANYPSQGASNLTAGVKMAINTTGYKNIKFEFDIRQSEESSNTNEIFYTTDGSTWISCNSYTIPTSGCEKWYYRTYDFSAITAANNNPNFAIKLVSKFNTGSNYYSAKDNNAAGYAGGSSGGKYRFDNIVFSGDTITPTLVLTSPAAVCNPNTVNLTASAVTTGSTSGYPYTYWTNAAATSALSSPSAVATSGTYYIKLALKDTISGVCSVKKPVTVTVHAKPTALVLTGSSVCTGGTTTITSSTSVSGVSYQLYNSSNTAVGSAQSGTGSGLTWSSIAAGTGYYVIATNANSCTATSNSVNVVINTPPSAPTVSVTQAPCGASAGSVAISSSTAGLSFSTDGTNYAAYSTAYAVNAGAGYSITAKNTTSGCVSTATTGTLNAALAVPSAPTVSVTQAPCGASAGSVAISSSTDGLSFSTDGTNYAAYSSAYAVNAGAGYSITAKNTTSGCVSTATTGTLNTALIVPSVSVSDVSVCAGNAATLSASSTDASADFEWYATNSSTDVLSSSASYLTAAITADTDFYVLAKNSTCSSARSTVNVSVGGATLTWNGSTSSDWNEASNWTPAAVPTACTDVIIPAGTVNYPTISSTGECQDIRFKTDAGVLGLQNLTYRRAFIEMNFKRNVWYTLTSPLKEMHSGDFFFGGAPVVEMKLFDAFDPDGKVATKYTGQWTRSFSSLTAPLESGAGFSLRISSLEFNYPSARISNNADLSVTLPRTKADGSLIKTWIPYNSLIGKPYPQSAISATKDSSLAYRFANEDASGVLQDSYITLLPGINLVGNPLMSHLDFSELYDDNDEVISNTVKLWNGLTFVSYMLGIDYDISSEFGNQVAQSIPPMMSFFVYSPSGGVLKIRPSKAFTCNNNTKLRRANTTPNQLFITSSNGVETSTACVSRNALADNKFSSDDAFKMFTQYKQVPEVYTLANQNALDINKFSNLPYSTPLCINSTQADTVKLNFNGADSFEDVSVRLINTLTGETQDLKENSNYDFNFDGTNGEGTLFLEFRNASIVSDVEQTASASSIQILHKGNGNVRVLSSPQDKIQQIAVFDELGRSVLALSKLDVAMQDFLLPNQGSFYVVKVISEKDNKTAKLIIK